MIPDLPNLSDPAMPADFLRPYNREKAAFVDYARGGVALLDPSRGLNVKDWTCYLQEGGCFISASDVPIFKVETIDSRADWISMAFDQNMHYNLAYKVPNEGAYLYWYDAAQNRYVTDSLGNVFTPILRMDDVRHDATGSNDLVLSYIRGNSLCVRIQRDRFGLEYVLATNAGSRIVQCGMNRKMRFQWNCI